MAHYRTRCLMGVVFFSCVLTAMFGGAVMAAAKGGPEQAVHMVRKAIEANDMAMLESCLDLDAVIHKGVEVAVNDDSVVRAVEKYPAATLVLALGSSSGTNEAIRGMLTGEVREYVRHGVVSGAFAGKPREGVSVYNGLFGKAFRGGEKDKVEIGSPTVKKKDKGMALVAVDVTRGIKGRTYPVELVIKKVNERWRIVEIANMADLVRQPVEGTK